MIVADRVKQTALVTAFSSSIYTINLDSGAAATGHRTFRVGLNVPNTTAVPGVINNRLVPVIVESGVNWMSGMALVSRDGAGALGNLTLTLDGTQDTFSTNSLGAITNGSTVTIYVGENAGLRSGVRVRGDQISASGFDYVFFGTDSEVALGRSSRALGIKAIAIGYNADATGADAVAIGNAIDAIRQLAHVRGHTIADYGPHSDNFGLNLDPVVVGAYGNINTTIINENSIRTAVTTNATPVKVAARDIYTPASTLANSDDFYCDSGVSVFLATITAFEPATDVTKVWKLEFAVKTKLNFSASAFVGTQVKTVMGTDTGSATWDVAAVLVGASEHVAIEVTGEAAKNIFWTASVKAHRNVIY